MPKTNADALELYLSSEMNTTLEYADNNIKVKQVGKQGGYGIRALKNKKLGFSYCVEPGEIEKTVNNAIELSKYSTESRFEFAPKCNYPQVKTYDKKTAMADETELNEILKQIKSGVEKYTKKARILVDVGISNTVIENSEGLYAKCEYSGFTTYCEAMNKDGMGFDYYSGISLPKDPSEIGERAGKMSKEMIGAKKIASGKYQVVFSPEAIHSMLDIMLPSLSGEGKRKKTSRLWNMQNQHVVSDKFSIVDDRTANASMVAPFDEEGTASKKIPLLENGVLKNYLYSRETAALEGVDHNGSCSRASFTSKPSISCSNLIIKPGDYGDFEKELNEFILIKSVHGVHTSNITTGDFGVEGNIAFKFSDGKKTPVRGFIVSGNIFNVFNNIIGLERKQQVYDNLITPSIACSDVQIVG